MKFRKTLTMALLASALSFLPLRGQEDHAHEDHSQHGDLLAEGKGFQISEDLVMREAAQSLSQLEMEKQRFQAEQKKKRHQVIQNSLEKLVGDRVLKLEAEARDMEPSDLLQEVYADVREPTEEDIDRFYQANQRRIQKPKEEIASQIEGYLRKQWRDAAAIEYLQDLGDKYDAEYYLEPLRFDVEADDFPALGPEDAPVTIVEFSDFECPYCSRVGPTLKRITEEYGDSVRLVFRQFPLSNIHPSAQDASEASLCAADQGQFWEMHDLLFADQKNLKHADLLQKAQQLNLDLEAFEQCLSSNEYEDEVLADLAAGTAVGVTGTPAFFVNGRPMSGAIPYERIAETVDDELQRLGLESPRSKTTQVSEPEEADAGS